MNGIGSAACWFLQQKRLTFVKYQQEKALATRHAVMQAALRVFCRKGFLATTLGDVAAEAKLSRGAIYWNFENKQELYVSLVREYFEKNIHDTLRTHAEEISDPVEGLRDYMYGYNLNLLINSEVRAFMELIRYKTEVKTLAEEILMVQQRMDLLMKEALQLFVRRGRELDRFRHDLEESAIVMAALSFLNGIESTWLFNPDIYPLDEKNLKTLTDFFVDSLLNREYQASPGTPV